MSRIEQVNSLLQQQIAVFISEEIMVRGGLVTVVYVDCSPDLREAIVAVSVLPERLTGTVLRQLRRKSSSLTKVLRSRLTLRHIPALHWKLDTTEREAADLEEVFQHLT